MENSHSIAGVVRISRMGQITGGVGVVELKEEHLCLTARAELRNTLTHYNIDGVESTESSAEDIRDSSRTVTSTDAMRYF